MRPRHRIPSIFNLYMLDVMCGALGAVVILWLYKEEQTLKLAASEQQLSSLEKQLSQQLNDERLRTAKLSESGKKLVADLLVLRLAHEKLSAEDQATLAQLAVMRADKDTLMLSEKDLKTRVDDLQKLEASLRLLLANAEAERKSDRKKLDTLTTQLSDLGKDKTGLEGTLALRKKDLEELEKKLTALLKVNERLDTDLNAQARLSNDRKKQADDLTKLIETLNEKLKNSQTSMSALQKTADEVPKLLDELKGYRGKLGTEEGRVKALRGDLERRMAELDDANKKYEAILKAKGLLEKNLDAKVKDLADALVYKEKLADTEKKRVELQDLLGDRVRDLVKANRSMEELKTEREKLVGDIARMRVILDQRFAGIELTGRRVVFLVDMSGSMDLLDEKTPAVTKWAAVRETLAQLMKSLPNLEKFQVVVFSEDSKHLFGKPGEWIDFDAKTSPDRVREELAKIKPLGGTNMYKGMDATFRYRAEGLDTVYLFSDGLPNEGDGLTPEQEKSVTEQTARSSLLAGYIRRKLRDDWNRTQQGRARVKINSVGFYYESPDVGAFLWALSRENEGSFVGMSKP